MIHWKIIEITKIGGDTFNVFKLIFYLLDFNYFSSKIDRGYTADDQVTKSAESWQKNASVCLKGQTKKASYKIQSPVKAKKMEVFKNKGILAGKMAAIYN